jgi:mono/diheme cytochrome c family protein
MRLDGGGAMGEVSPMTAPTTNPMRHHLLALAFTLPALAHGQGAAIFKDADLALGEKLLAEHQCAQCHTRQVGGDGSAIYRPAGRINNAGLLRGMVENCSTRLNLQLFPEEVTAIAAVLNRDHYRFKP